MLEEPAKGSFYDPAFRQDVEAGCGVAATHDFDLDAGALFLDPLGEFRPTKTAIGPDLEQLRVTLQNGFEQHLGPFPLGRVSGEQDHIQNQA